jgi:hypothetical protein
MGISWEAKRRNAIKRLLALCDESEDDDDLDDVRRAIDMIAVTHIAVHIAASRDWELDSVTGGPDPAAAIERLVEAWERYDEAGEDDPEAEERLNVALDALTLAHVTYTFEWANGPRKW